MVESDAPSDASSGASSGALGTRGWPLAQVARDAVPKLLGDLARRFDCLPSAPWDVPATQAMILPIPRPGTHGPAGVLVLAINPRRAFDDDYRGFFDLVTSHVATALSNARAQEEERRRADTLAELDRAKTAFFGNVSHEFRTPLTLILGPIENARERGSLEGADLQVVHRNAIRLLRLVNSLLDFSRIEAGRLQSTFEPTDLAALTSGLGWSFQSLVEPAGLKLVVQCPPLRAPVYVDRSHWEKIVLNLVSNAFKFTFAGQIVVRLDEQDDSAVLSVSDTGTGIPEHELPRVFERFHRVEGAKGRSFEGTGIGLALVSELAKAHGGKVGVQSTLGHGSTFTVSIPFGSDHLPKERVVRSSVVAARPDSPRLHSEDLAETQWLRRHEADPKLAVSADAGSGDASRGMVGGERARILVADDNPDMREYLRRLLEPYWNVEVVGDGQAALDSATARPPDLVLSDVMMPRMDGVALLRALRAERVTHSVLVILISARAGEESVLQGLDTGADDYLVKPFSARELVTRVRTHLAMAKTRQAAAQAARDLADTRGRLLDDIARKNRELEAFSYSVSHDLRAPLRGIAGFTSILIEDYEAKLGAEGQDYLHRIQRAVERMGQLIDDLLELSRLERAELRREEVDLSPIAQRVAEALQRSEPRWSGEVVIAPKLSAHVDPRLMQIVFENLLGNARKFTRDTPHPKVELGVLDVEGTTTFFVKDNGAGFDAAYAGKLFAPFQRLHSEKDFPGTGIGLATVSRIVGRHGGKMWAEGVVGGGATIFWTLPPPAPTRA
jgi:signal transduction histidine kinase